ncbi:hypothetical protein QU864_27230, partial [Escherichia coli]|nr:hypothetical protein [Escherichia coli]
TRLDIEVNGFNGGVLNGVPSAYHWYTERYGVKWPCGYDLNISSQGENFIQVDFDTPWCQPESDVVAELSRLFGCTLEHWYAEQGCDFCGWQLYGHCCKVSDEAAFCLIQRPYISKTLL